jgi:ABC-type polysaccharide/polyol phosphate transport system ATPase subunit
VTTGVRERSTASAVTNGTRPEGGARAPGDRPLSIQALGISKSFRIPLQANSTLAQRIIHPHTRHGYRTLPVLENISFEVAQGEFFGIIGRNGSGKSTLLKLLASIYGADTGTIRVAGQVAPILELGVGFHPELAARDNAIVNGVMMGLTQKQAADRFEKVIEFAELEGFETMKLRNFSSGMKIRLAFAIMVEADGDVMMIDEVLAVGDSGFQRKCSEVFRQYKERGKTVILVSHQMTSIRDLCDRVMLLEGGHIERIGDPDEATRRYSELAVAGTPAHPVRAGGPQQPATQASIADLWVSDANGERTPVVPGSDPIRIHAVIEAESAVEDPYFRFEIRNQNRARIFSPPSTRLNGDRLEAGKRVRVEATIENKLTPGTYILSCALNRQRDGKEIAASGVTSVEFAVPGERPRGQGLLSLEHEVTLEPLGETEASGERDGGP